MQPDSSVQECDLTVCARLFSLFTRRHHCRRCGGIFCAEHSSFFVPLDQHARFNAAASTSTGPARTAGGTTPCGRRAGAEGE